MIRGIKKDDPSILPESSSVVAGTAAISNRFIADFTAIIDFSKFLNSKLVLNSVFDNAKVN